MRSAASWIVAGAVFAAASVIFGSLVRHRRRARRAIDTGSVSTRWLTEANWERDE